MVSEWPGIDLEIGSKEAKCRRVVVRVMGGTMSGVAWGEMASSVGSGYIYPTPAHCEPGGHYTFNPIRPD